jgi:large subunit ribosomal protein L24
MKIRKGDTVIVISGKDKGKKGKVTAVDIKNATVTIPELNLYKRHMKKTQQYPQGGIVEIARPLHISKVMLVCPKTQKPTRVAYRIVGGIKRRYSVKAGEVIE